MQLEDLQVDAHVAGLLPGQTVQIIRVQPVSAEAAQVTFRDAGGTPREQLVFRQAAEQFSLVEQGRPWAFTADGADFKLAAEALRIQLAHLFDPMMAVHTSDVLPLPHQISAVYESMLPKQPLRYVLADDPGAGKTIMAGLLIRELMMRGDADRVLIVAPGSLVEQWQDELRDKFGVDFDLFTRDVLRNTRVNPFQHFNHLIARLDQLSRAEDIQQLLYDSEWDLVIFDEAHKLSAHYYGQELKKTGRYEMAEKLGARTRHLLLMTATPHNGKDEDFQAFLALLDSDRFYGKYRDGAHQVDTRDLMRRMVKEQLVTFENEKLFPERRAYTINYPLSAREAALYHAVTNYVREQMNAAQRLEGGRKGTVGFALTVLQRRLASSPEAIYQSLHRRRKRLEKALREAKLDHRGLLYTDSKAQDLWYDDEDFDDLTSEEIEAREDAATDDAASAAQTIEELEKEVVALRALEQQADELRAAKEDRKWNELSSILQDNPEMKRPDGSRRKIIIFTEHKDTLVYLADQIRGMIGSEDAVQVIYGGTPRDERRKIQERFRQDPDVLVLVATDAAGEGVNLQTTNLMVNYDLPWNPNRLEQRFGRIHRIGQKEVCHLWNLVAAETREGDVYHRLLDKLEVARKALGGRVFDIIGELFEGRSLKDMLIEAIMGNGSDRPPQNVFDDLDQITDLERIKALQHRHALIEDVMTPEHLYEVKAEMDRAEARKLQPFYIRSFFQQAFARTGGELLGREAGRYEIRHVPVSLRNHDRLVGAREPVLKKYERVCFEKANIDVDNKAKADLIHPAHPLMASLIEHTLNALRGALREGAILVDENDLDGSPRVLFVLDHVVREGHDPDRHASRRLQLVEIDEHGHTRSGGAASYLDYRVATDTETTLAGDLLNASWLQPDKLEQTALAYATQHLVNKHFDEIQQRRLAWVEKTLEAVHARLVKEINFQQGLLEKLKRDVAAGKQPQVQVVNKERLIAELQDRLTRRTAELEGQKQLSTGMPTVAGTALILSMRWLNELQGTPEPPADARLRRIVEQIAMKVVMKTEESLGNRVEDVSAQNYGWDVEAMTPKGELRRIEVKGRRMGATTVTITRNEQLEALNKPERYFLAIVFADGDRVDGPHYVEQPFTNEPDPVACSTNFNLAPLLQCAFDPRKSP